MRSLPLQALSERQHGGPRLREGQDSRRCRAELSPEGRVSRAGHGKGHRVEGVMGQVASLRVLPGPREPCLWFSGATRWAPTVSLHALHLDVRALRMGGQEHPWNRGEMDGKAAQQEVRSVLATLLHSQAGRGQRLSGDRCHSLLPPPRFFPIHFSLWLNLIHSETRLLLPLRTHHPSPGHLHQTI